jgi:small ligand-binding sensory domain FIST
MATATMADRRFAYAHAADADWRQALDHCLARIEVAGARRGGVEWTLGWIYLAEQYGAAAPAILEQLQRRLPGVAWVGATALGICASGVEYIGVPALALMLAPLPRESFRVFSGHQPLSAAGFSPWTALVHADGQTPDLADLLIDTSDRTETGYLFGGVASARQHALHIANKAYTGGLSGVAFGPEVGMVSRVTQGCQPIGPLRTVTRAERNFLVTLDGEPALDCVLRDLGLPKEIGDEDLLGALASTLVGIELSAEDVLRRPGQFGAETLVRHLLGVGRQQGLLSVAETVTAGMRLAFCHRNAMVAQLDLARIATEIRDEVERDGTREMAGAVYVSCSGRGGPHFGAPHAELQLLQSILGELPLVGFFANGEIARRHLYGYTGVLTVFTSARG